MFVNFGLDVEDGHNDEMLKHKLIVLTEPKHMLIRHAVFHCELFQWFIFLAECEIFNFVNVDRRTRTASLRR